MSEEKCIVCSKNNWSILRKLSNRNVVICKNCCLTKLDPAPNSGELQDFYAGEYRKVFSLSDTVGQKVLSTEKLRADSIVPYLKEYESNLKRHLDIGCSTGTLLDEIKKNLTSINQQSAIELNDNYRAYVESKKLVNDSNGIYSQPIEDCEKLESNSYDLCTIVHVLEHTSDPKLTLTQINRVMKEGGILYIEVPNLKTPYSKLTNGYFIIYHLFYFSEKTLKHLLNICGFTIIRSITQHNTSIAFVCEKKNQEPDFDFDQYQEIEKLLLKYDIFYYFKRILIKLGARQFKNLLLKIKYFIVSVGK